ncbi:Hypothetical predicted protein, partial [Marmota monax]
LEKRGRVHNEGGPGARKAEKVRDPRDELQLHTMPSLSEFRLVDSRPLGITIVETRGQQTMSSSFLILLDLKESFFCSALEDPRAEKPVQLEDPHGCGCHLLLSGSIVRP